MLSRKAFHQLSVSLTLIVGSLSHFLLHLLEFLFNLRLVSESLTRLLLHGRIVRKLHYLWEITDCRIVWYRHNAARRLLHSTENLQHR